MDNILNYENMSEYESSDSEQNIIKSSIRNLDPASKNLDHASKNLDHAIEHIISTTADVIINSPKEQPIIIEADISNSKVTLEDVNCKVIESPQPVIINRRSLLLLRR